MSVAFETPSGRVIHIPATPGDLFAAVLQKLQRQLEVEALSCPDIAEDLHGLPVGSLGVVDGIPLTVAEPGKRVEAKRIARTADASVKAALEDLSLVYGTDANSFRIYVSGQQGVGSHEALQTHQISNVVNCCDRIVCPFAGKLKYKVCKSFFDTRSTQLCDHILPVLEFLDEVEKCGEGVLVHCMSGASRSTSCVIAWLMTRKDMSFDQAFAMVKSGRAITRPNAGFHEQLKLRAFLKPREDPSLGNNKRTFLRRGTGKRMGASSTAP